MARQAQPMKWSDDKRRPNSSKFSTLF
jgi:hypothetical protein